VVELEATAIFAIVQRAATTVFTPAVTAVAAGDSRVDRAPPATGSFTGAAEPAVRSTPAVRAASAAMAVAAAPMERWVMEELQNVWVVAAEEAATMAAAVVAQAVGRAVIIVAPVAAEGAAHPSPSAGQSTWR
jgi:hypothetical protein